MTRRRPIVFLLALVLSTARPAAAMTVLPLDLAELTAGAGTIFVGRVTRVDPGVDERGIAAVWTTFAVDDALKGAPGPTLTLKQLGAPLGAGVFPSVPRFVPGESVMLFVHPVSALGFASPVGLGQGTFRIREHDGRRVAANDVGNRNLDAGAPGVAPGAHRATPPAVATAGAPADLPLDTLVARVRTLMDPTP